jgi:glycosyltransferase involved in cell wall biosynthesis
MHIAYVCADPGVPVYGRKGSSNHVQEVIRSLQAHGARVELFATRVDGLPPPGLESVRLHRLPLTPKGDQSARERAALAANQDLRAALDAAGPFDLVYERYSLWSFAAMEVARAYGVPGLLEVNAPLVEEQAEYRELVDREAAEQVAARAFGAATALIAVSDEVGAYLTSFQGTAGRIHVVPNGVNLDRFPLDLRPSRPGRPAAFTIGFVGTLKPWHGLPFLVEAYANLHEHEPRTRLLVVGGGPGQPGLEADLAARGLREGAELTGMVDPTEVPGLLASMDVAVAPYPSMDHFYFSPLKVYEYMAAGRVTVASRIGQLSGLIIDGVNGLLCPPGDAIALASALEHLRGEPRLRARLGRAARATVQRSHTWDAVTWRILDIAGLQARSQGRGLEVAA